MSSPDPESLDQFSTEDPLYLQPSMETTFNGSEFSSERRRPYSTTSSVYAEHTLSNPDNDQVIYW